VQSILLDIRSPTEYAAGHLPDSILIPTDPPPNARWDLTDRYLHWVMYGKPLDMPVYVYCKKGVRAHEAEQMLRRLGHTHVISLGGVEEGKLADDLRAGVVSLVR